MTLDPSDPKFIETGAPKRHRLWQGPSKSPAWDMVLDSLEDLYGTGMLVALVGKRGPGKTQLAVELIRRAVQEEKKARYIRAMDLFVDLKSTYGSQDRNGANERTVLDKLAEPKLLVIDEIQEGAGTDFEARMMTYAIDVRYSSCRDTILCGNFAEDGSLEQRLGDSCVSRLNECGGIMWCRWPSFRE